MTSLIVHAPLTLPLLVGRAIFATRQALREAWRFCRGLVERHAPPVLHLFEAPTRGGTLRMLLRRPGLIEDRLVADGVWEKHVRDALAFHLPERGLFVDVGANIGYHTLYLACSRPAARVVAFEPNPLVRAQLEANVRSSGCGNVVVRSCALGDRAGTASLFAQDERDYNRGRSSLQRNLDLGRAVAAVPVECRTLDELFPDERVDLIKLDTQGTELAVLAGAQQLIRRCRPIVVLEFEVEYLGDGRAAFAALGRALDGYSLLRIHQRRCELSRFDPRDIRGARFKVDLLARP
jgi:FkbM family methyltransferase